MFNSFDSLDHAYVFLYSYLKGAKEGDEIVIDANTVRAGRNLAYLECELRNKKDGSLIAKGSQTKYVGGGGGGIDVKNN